MPRSTNSAGGGDWHSDGLIHKGPPSTSASASFPSLLQQAEQRVNVPRRAKPAQVEESSRFRMGGGLANNGKIGARLAATETF